MQVYVLLDSTSGVVYGVTKDEEVADWFQSLDASAHRIPEFKVGDVSEAYAEFGDPEAEEAEEEEEPDDTYDDEA
jgi:hypothetical protein